MIGGSVELGAEGCCVFGEIGKKVEKEENSLRDTFSVLLIVFLFFLFSLHFYLKCSFSLVIF